MMKQLPMSSSISEFSEVDPSWTSSSKDCATIGRHYESIFLQLEHSFQFLDLRCYLSFYCRIYHKWRSL